LAGGGGIAAKGRALAARARRAVVITAGPAGAYLFPSGGAAIRIAAPDIASRDTTGAGDAFAGAFAARLAETGDLIDATRQGTAPLSAPTPQPSATASSIAGISGTLPSTISMPTTRPAKP